MERSEPKTKEELIQKFWGTVDKNKCLKYITFVKSYT